MAVQINANATLHNVQNNPHYGPWVDGNDNLYVVTRDGSSIAQIAMWKSTDGGANWSQIDSANQPAVTTGTPLVAGISGVQDEDGGTLIHIAFCSDEDASSMSPSTEFRYATFHTSDDGSNPDTWQIDEAIATLGTGGQPPVLGIATRSDGDVIVSHAGAGETIMGSGPFWRSSYSRREGGTWTTDVHWPSNQAGVGNSARAGDIVRGSNDTIHKFYDDRINNANSGSGISLDSDNTQGGVVDLDGTAVTPFRPITWDLSGSQKIMVHAHGTFSMRRVEENPTTGRIQVESGHFLTDPGVNPDLSEYRALARLSSGEVVAIYNSSNDDDVYQAQSTEGVHGDWGNHAEVVDAVTATHISAESYFRGGVEKVGLVYLNGGSVYFDELEFAPPDETVQVGLVTESEQPLNVNRIPLQVATITENEQAKSVGVKEKYQYLRPIADDAAGFWTPTPLWSKVDEEDPDVSDFITSEGVSTGDTSSSAILRLTSTGIVDPGPSASVIIRATWRTNIVSGDPIPTSTFEIRNRSDNSVVWNDDLTHPPNGEWGTSEMRLGRSAVEKVLDWNDLAIEMHHTTAFINIGTSSLSVAWVEIEIINPDFKVPMAGVRSVPYGFAGPLKVGLDTYVLAQTVDHTGSQLWLFRATDPSDGHNPEEWECLALLDRTASGEILSVDLMEDGNGDLNVGVLSTNDHANFAQQLWRYALFVRWDVSLEVIDVVGGRDGGTFSRWNTESWSEANRIPFTQIGVGRQAAGDYHLIYGDTTFVDPDTVLYTKLQHILSDGTYSSGETDAIGVTTDDDYLATFVQVGDRYHVFMTFSTPTEEGDNRQRTRRANHSFQSAPTSSWASQDLVSWGVGATWNDGVADRVVVPFRSSSGGIYVASFNSVDSPAISEQLVTDRDAHKGEYTTTPVALGEGDHAWVFWIDEAAGDAIYVAQRSGSSWHNIHQVVSGGGHSFDKIGVDLVAAGTAGILASTREGQLYYYEVALVPTTPVGLVTENEQAQVVTPQSNLIRVEAVFESEQVQIVAPTTKTSVGLVSESELAQAVGLKLGIGIVSEAEQPQTVIPKSNLTVVVGAVSESESPLTVTPRVGEFSGWGIPISSS